MAKGSSDHFTTQKSTMIFLIIASIIVIVVIVLCVLNYKNKSEKNLTLGYDKVYDLGGYAVKINSMTYLSNINELDFVYYCKEAKNGRITTSVPEVYSINYYLDDEGKEQVSNEFTYRAVNDIQTVYTVNNTTLDKVKAVSVTLQYKNFDYYDPDVVDEFGDVKEGEFHEGEMNYFRIDIDVKDISIIDGNEFIVPNLNTDDLDNAENIETTTTMEPESEIEVSTTTTTEATTTTKATTTKKTTTTTYTEEVPLPPPDYSVTSRKSYEEEVPLPPPDYSVTSRKSYEEEIPVPPPDYSVKVTAKSTTTTTTKPTETITKKTTTTTTTTKKTTTTTKPKETTTTKASTTKKEVVHVNTLALDQAVVNLEKGKSLQINPVFEPINATDSFTWESNRTDRVVVDKNGKVKAVGSGSAIITCTDKENGLTASCMVTVQ